MTFQSDSEVMGREPLVIVELDVDFCANTYSQLPCTADGNVGEECFNSFFTCQDPTNYVKTIKTFRFIQSKVKMPIAQLDAIPCIDSIQITPPRLAPSEGMGARASVDILARDFAHNDRLIDKYVTTRLYDPLERGTFWGKFKARYPFITGRALRVYEGYFKEDGSFNLADFLRRDYFIESIDGPDGNNRVRIKAKDILKKTNIERAQCPLASDGVLDAAITAAATTITLQAGFTTVYADAFISIGDEIIDVSGASFVGGTWTGAVRGAGGTTAEDHDAGDAVQDCKSWSAINVIDIIRELLEDFSGIPTSFIPYADWTTEKNRSLTSFNLTTILAKPTSVIQLLNELVEQVLLEVYWDEIAKQIKLRHETQWIAESADLNDADHLLADSIVSKDRPELRLSRVWVWYGMLNYAEDLDKDNFKLLGVRVASGPESANEHGDIRVKNIFSRWFNASNVTAVNLLTQRLLDRFGNTPVELAYALDAKHESLARLGDVPRITTRYHQDATGALLPTRFQVIEYDPVIPGHRYEYKALQFNGEPKTELIISVNTANYDIFTELGEPPEPVDVTLTVEAGVIVSGNPAITTGNLHPDSRVTIINLGEIIGDGGAGGSGGGASILWEAEPPGTWFGSAANGNNGAVGKDGINLTVSTTIDNDAGFIAGGGGAGGGGGGWSNTDTGECTGGGGGGAGRGGVNSFGGGGGDAQVIGSIGTATDGQDGGDATKAGGAGTGGAGGLSGQAGGNGGDYAQAGTSGSSVGTYKSGDPGAGGAPGRAVRTNGHALDWIGGNNPTQVKGVVG